MIVIGEKLNAMLPLVKRAVIDRNSAVIKDLACKQTFFGADYLDCMVGGIDHPQEAMSWMIDTIQEAVETPLCLDSGNSGMLRRIVEMDRLARPGIINSISGASRKCELILPLIAGTKWQVIALTYDEEGMPTTSAGKVAIVGSLLEQAAHYGVKTDQLIFDPCVMAMTAIPTAMMDFEEDVRAIHAAFPEARVIGAISNISYKMPERQAINAGCLTMAVRAGVDVVMIDPCGQDMRNALYASQALSAGDHAGIAAYTGAWRRGMVSGVKK